MKTIKRNKIYKVYFRNECTPSGISNYQECYVKASDIEQAIQILKNCKNYEDFIIIEIRELDKIYEIGE